MKSERMAMASTSDISSVVNFAYITHVLEDQGIVASRIGNDQLGQDALQAMQQHELNTTYVQSGDRYPTGAGEISIDSDGQPLR
jgi:sugar/nucleoside kinase (ribokinase family)